MSTPFSRRDALKLGAMAMACTAARLPGPTPPWLQDQPYALCIGRVTVPVVYAYQEPRFDAERRSNLHRDQLLSILEEVQSPNGPAHNPLWYRTVHGYLHSGRIQRCELRPLNSTMRKLPETGQLVEVSVPFTRSYIHSTSRGWQPLYRLYYDSVHWATAVETGPDGGPWYRIQEHYPDYVYYAPAAHLRPISESEIEPISTGVPANQKRIEISISSQHLTAFEYDAPVFRASVSSGLPSARDLPEGEIPTDTPLGSFWIQSKMPSRHMGDGRLSSDIHAYELPGVPWTMLFHEDGIAIHGAYWHDNFGTRMSHGCVNMRNADARWLFRWTDPVYMPVDWFLRERGTLVTVLA